MRNWEERCIGDGAVIAADCLTVNEAPDDDALDSCKELGAALA